MIRTTPNQPADTERICASGRFRRDGARAFWPPRERAGNGEQRDHEDEPADDHREAKVRCCVEIVWRRCRQRTLALFPVAE